ncbi:MAG: acyl-CoA dehydrogenase family protein [Chloroflexi bacterium]|nr:acyl-CoA dehydrogenase family protein [Chloroflexota bacterium]
MNFAVEDSPELAAFRRHVGAWLDAHVPPEVRMSRERARRAPQAREWVRGLQRQLADQGWAAPSWPQAYGGGGLSPAHDRVVREELDARQVPQLYEASLGVAAAILSCGSERQRQRLVRPLLRGESAAWRAVGEADAVADPETVTLQAVKDGDVYLVSGEEVCWGDPDGPTYLWVLAVTDPDAPARRRLSAFLIPVGLPGLASSDRATIAPGGQRTMALEQVAVPVEYRIGDEGDGWLVVQSAFPVDGDADRVLQEQQGFVGMLVRYCRERLQGRQPAYQYYETEERMAEAYIDAQVLRVLALRNRWRSSQSEATTYHGAQFVLLAQAMRERLATAMVEVMGPLALLDDPEWAPMHGEMEAWQRASLPGVSPGERVAAQQRAINQALGFPGS